jgi:hypothetical protein
MIGKIIAGIIIAGLVTWIGVFLGYAIYCLVKKE